MIVGRMEVYIGIIKGSLRIQEVFSGPCLTSLMKTFAIAYRKIASIIFAESFILHVCHGC